MTPFTIAARTYLLVARNTMETSSSKRALRNIIQTAAFVFAVGEVNGLRWPNQTLVCEFNFSGGRKLVLRYVNHAGLIDLNSAQPELLAFGFRALGVSASNADDAAAAVAMFRATNVGPQDNSVALPVMVAGGVKGGPFEAVVELSDFEAFAAIPARNFEDVFTVHSKAGTLDRLRLTPVLETMAHGAVGTAMPYLVESGGRTPAVTVEADLYVNGTSSVSGRTVFAQAGEGEATALHLLEPISFEAYPNTNIVLPKGLSDPLCMSYFEPATTQLLAEFLS